MIEPTVNLGKFATVATWVVVGVLLASAWIIGLFVSWHVGLLLAVTGCATSAVAAVLHIRCFMVRVVTVVRALGVRGDSESVPLQRIH